MRYNSGPVALALSLLGSLLLEPTPASSDSLRTLGAGGVPAAGTSVAAYVPASSTSILESRRGAVVEGKTDAQGLLDFALPKLPRVFLVLDSPAHRPAIHEVGSETKGALTYQLDPGLTLRGCVRAQSGATAPSSWKGRVCARWSLTSPLLSIAVPIERCTELLPSGRFNIPGLDAQAQGELSIEAEGFLPLKRKLMADLSQAIVLETGTAVEGLAVSASGRPIVGAKVRDVSSRERRAAAWLAADGAPPTQTDAAGRFSLRVSAFPARLAVSAPGYRQAFVTLAAGSAHPHRVVLNPGATLEARVLASTGQTISKVSTRLLRETAPARWRAEDVDIPLEKSGELRLELPQPGRYRIELRSPGLLPFSSEPYEVSATQGIDLGSITLASGGGVEGKVVDAESGATLAGALVTLWPQGLAGSQRLATRRLGQAVTDLQGHYRITGQDEGAYELRFERRPFPATYREIVLTPDIVAALSDETLGAGLSVHGRVRTQNGKPRAGVAVRFLARDGGSLLPVAEATTGADGVFSGLRLASDSYRVEVVADRILLAETVEIGDSLPETGLDLRTPETSLAGIVLRGGEPLSGGLLAVQPAGLADPRLGRLVLESEGGQRQVLGGSEPGTIFTQVEEGGTFHFEEAPQARLLFTYTSPDGRIWTRTADLPPANASGESFLRLELSGKGLEGLVSDKQTGEPLAGVAVAVRDSEGRPLGLFTSAADGSFSAADLAAEMVQVEASKSGYTTALLTARPGSAQPLHLDLDPADSGALTVRLTSPNGQPMGFTFVSILSAAGAMVRSLPLDAQGQKGFQGLPAGTYRVAWSDPGSGLGVSGPVIVRAGEEATFETVLAEPAQLQVSCPAETCARQPVEALGLYSATPIDLSPLLPGFSPGLTFPAGGPLRLGTLQPGHYDLVVQIGGRVASFKVDARAGQLITVPLAAGSPRSRTTVAAR